MTAPAGFRHVERLRVRHAEVDGGRIGFAGHYLGHFDAAFGGYWRALALPYRDTMDQLQGALQLHHVELDIEAPALDDDLLEVGLRCARVAHASLVFDGEIRHGDRLLVRAALTQQFVDARSGEPRPVPADLREVLLGFEAGRAMLEVRVGDWATLARDARPIRAAVFIDEQKIPAEMEWDAADAGCVHAVAYNHFGLALGTGRMLEHVPGTAKIGRMAVLPGLRGSGVGRAVLDALMAAARARGDREVLLHAQWSAAPFYQRAGFLPRGPRFDEAGIAHQEMVRVL